MNLIAKSYSGRYGATEVGDIIHLHIDMEPEDEWTMNKEVVLVIDISGSMEESMKNVKSSILAFRDALVGKTAKQMEAMSSYERNQLIKNTVDLRLITFSNTAKEVWNSTMLNNFEDVVIGLNTEAMTNMGAGLELAFRNLNKQKGDSWIIVMTDGESNEGTFRTATAFQQLVTSNKPLNCKVISLGYGNRFDPEVLDKIGTFVYVENKEMIPVVLGNIAEEIMLSVISNFVINIEGQDITELTDDTIIIPMGVDEKVPGKVIVGNRVMGVLCAGKSYDYIYLPHGNNVSPTWLHNYKTIGIEYVDMITGETVNINVPINHSLEISDSVRELYFIAEKKRLIYKLYQVLQKGDKKLIKEVMNRTKTIIADWGKNITDVGFKHRDEIEQMLNNNNLNNNINNTLNYAVGSNYNNNNINGNYVGSALASTNHYLASPLIN